MQSLPANEAPVPITAYKRKNDDEGNSTNTTVKKRKKTQRKPKKRLNMKEEVHVSNDAARETDQDSSSGTFLDWDCFGVVVYNNKAL
jgi:hypothetical protein